jgi:hypothetical protein
LTSIGASHPLGGGRDGGRPPCLLQNRGRHLG